ncbi:hypothetical protein OL239_16585 [Arthrobacter sp. ATA002]|uniref:hypothetical protein n=1 Tax=Arthrobacter sp. ATA002 TaxID=2991715 RepID=UPI0022A68B20|nr:hypothetical protein [Arthrobacter sp. ATA002]WAP51417.1 hypothetical protein OL239_16585 [Arthrobacter sp. ATA002]
MAMTIELARVAHRERMAEVESRRRRRAARDQARERSGKEERTRTPAVEWPVFTLRIGRFQLVGFRTVRL